jgi:hypothetical protein
MLQINPAINYYFLLSNKSPSKLKPQIQAVMAISQPWVLDHLRQDQHSSELEPPIRLIMKMMFNKINCSIWRSRKPLVREITSRNFKSLYLNFGSKRNKVNGRKAWDKHLHRSSKFPRLRLIDGLVLSTKNWTKMRIEILISAKSALTYAAESEGFFLDFQPLIGYYS